MRFFKLMLLISFVPFYVQGQQNFIDSLKTAFDEVENDIDKTRILVQLASFSQDRAEALDYAKRSLTYAMNDETFAISLNQIAWCQKDLFEFDSARGYAGRALTYALKSKGIVLGDVYNTYGSIFNNQSDFDSAVFYHKLALETRGGMNDREGEAISMNNITIALQRLARYDEAREYIDGSIAIYDEIGMHRRKADSYLNRGNLLVAAADLDGAYESFQTALKSYESQGLSVMMTYALINMGEVAVELKNIERAKASYQQSLTILKANGEIANLMAFALGGLGAIYEGYDIQPDSALYYNKESLEYAKKAGNVYLQSIAHHNLGTLYHNLKEYGVAERNLKTSEQLKNQIGDRAGLSLVLASLGRTYGLQRAFVKSKESFSKAMEIAKDVKDIDNIQKVLTYRYEVEKLKGDYESALKSYEEMTVLKDSLLNADHLNRVAELNIEYDTEKQQQEIELQNAQIAGQDTRLERNQALITGLIIVALLLFVIVFLIRNRAKKEQTLIKQEGELKLREAEINAVINSQEKERNRFAKDLHDGFGQMISVLKMNLGQLGSGKDPEKQLEVFEQSEEVIGDMYTELRNICFDLMPQTLVQSGLPEALKEFGHRVSSSGDKVLEVLIFDLDERLAELTEVSLYRISQEWVNNILKYSGADQITLQLTRDEAELTLTIEDNGKGFNPEDFFSGKGNGWRNIQSRINLMKGEFELDSRVGVKGTLMSVNVPVTTVEKIPTGTEEEIAV